MAEPLSTLQIVDHLGDLVSLARSLEMAICGSASIDPLESRALNRLAETLVEEINSLHRSLDAQLETEREGQQ
jgi:hypothetical protein